jgi:putative transcriptional regulator
MTVLVEDVVRSRLKTLISERNTERLRHGKKPLTTLRIAEEANIAHSTLTGLTANRSGMVNFTTLQKLCRFFNCTPGDILEYIPEDEDRRPDAVDRLPTQEEMGTYQGKHSVPVLRTLTQELEKRMLNDPWFDID